METHRGQEVKGSLEPIADAECWITVLASIDSVSVPNCALDNRSSPIVRQLLNPVKTAAHKLVILLRRQASASRLRPCHPLNRRARAFPVGQVVSEVADQPGVLNLARVSFLFSVSR